MNAPQNLALQMAEKPNDQLLQMLRRPDDWLPEALDAARAELQRRGVDASTIRIGPPTICPECNSERIVAGEMTSDGENCFVGFKPGTLRFLSLTLKNGVRLSQKAYACRDCGFTWGLVDPGELGEFIDRHCDQRESK